MLLPVLQADPEPQVLSSVQLVAQSGPSPGHE
jgi:hypothetical protein